MFVHWLNILTERKHQNSSLELRRRTGMLKELKKTRHGGKLISPPLTCLLLRGSRASRTPDMSNSRTCRLSWGRAMIFWFTDTLILHTTTARRLSVKEDRWHCINTPTWVMTICTNLHKKYVFFSYFLYIVHSINSQSNEEIQVRNILVFKIHQHV